MAKKNIIREEDELINIGKRAKKLRSLLFITQEDLAKALNINRKTLSKLESGMGFSDYTILKLSRFFGMNISEFTNYDLPYLESDAFKTKLIDLHEDNPEYIKLIKKPFSLAAIIEFKLSNSEFMAEPRRVKEIKEWIEELKIIKLSNENISEYLKAAVDQKLIKKHREKGNKRDYFYSKVK